MWLAAVLLSGSTVLAANECHRALNLNVQPPRDNHVILRELNARILANPSDACAFNNRARIRFFFGDIEGALADFESAIKFDPNMAFAYKNRGDMRLFRNELDLAIDDYGE